MCSSKALEDEQLYHSDDLSASDDGSAVGEIDEIDAGGAAGGAAGGGAGGCAGGAQLSDAELSSRLEAIEQEQAREASRRLTLTRSGKSRGSGRVRQARRCRPRSSASVLPGCHLIVS